VFEKWNYVWNLVSVRPAVKTSGIPKGGVGGSRGPHVRCKRTTYPNRLVEDTVPNVRCTTT